MNDRRADRRTPTDPLFGPLQLLVLRHLPLVLRSLVYGLGLLAVALGIQVIWPGARVAKLEAAERILTAADLVVNGRVDSLAEVLRGHLTDESVTRRATQIWLCLHSEPAEQDMLQLPCTALIQNASRRTIRRPR
jgi:hypothetical protein